MAAGMSRADARRVVRQAALETARLHWPRQAAPADRAVTPEAIELLQDESCVCLPRRGGGGHGAQPADAQGLTIGGSRCSFATGCPSIPYTTTPGASVPDALKVMQGAKVRQLPVVDDQGKLVGIVSLVDLFRVSPSPATSLTVWEIDYLLEKIKVESVMTKEVITTTEDTADRRGRPHHGRQRHQRSAGHARRRAGGHNHRVAPLQHH